MTDYDYLRAKALDASEGPWEMKRGREVLGGEPRRIVAQPRQAVNARYIAAVSPDVVLRLLERLEEAELNELAAFEEVIRLRFTLIIHAPHVKPPHFGQLRLDQFTDNGSEVNP